MRIAAGGCATAGLAQYASKILKYRGERTGSTKDKQGAEMSFKEEGTLTQNRQKFRRTKVKLSTLLGTQSRTKVCLCNSFSVSLGLRDKRKERTRNWQQVDLVERLR